MRFAGQGLQNFMGNVPDMTMMTNEALEGRSLERQTNHAAESQVAGTGLAAQAKIKEAEYMAEATKAQGQAEGMASMAGGIGSLASGIAGGIGSMGGGSSLGAVSRSPYAAPTQAGFKDVFKAGL